MDLICIHNLKINPQIPDCPNIYSFDLKTKRRSYTLYAPTAEERDLWVNGFRRFFQVPVIDAKFRPMEMLTRDSLNRG